MTILLPEALPMSDGGTVSAKREGKVNKGDGYSLKLIGGTDNAQRAS